MVQKKREAYNEYYIQIQVQKEWSDRATIIPNDSYNLNLFGIRRFPTP